MKAAGKIGQIGLTGLLIVLLCALLLPVQVSASNASGLKQTCVDKGIIGPEAVEALVRHPGDKKTQTMSISARWTPMPDDCDGHFLRDVDLRFQVQNPFNHRRWFDVGGWVTPMKDQEVVEEELEAEGKDCWKPIPGGEKFACQADLYVGNKGGEATSYAPDTRVPPDYFLADRDRYRCTPGKATTHVRAVVRNRVLNTESKRLAGGVTHKVTIAIKRTGRVPSRLRHRGRVSGPC